MTRARLTQAALLMLAAAITTAGCADSPTRYTRPYYPEGQSTSPYVETAGYAPAAEYAQADGYASASTQVVYPPGCYVIPIEPPCPPPCAAPAYVPAYTPPECPAPVCEPCAPAPVCGLPCEQRKNEWHVRAVAGKAFQFGADAGDGCFYYGADIGQVRCHCIGYDLFYRTTSCDEGKGLLGLAPIPDPTASIVLPVEFPRNGSSTKDGGRISWVGAKATYQRSIVPAAHIYGWVGAGPEFFWTKDYLHDDTGFGVFAELGLGWRFSTWGALRVGVDVHADWTSVGRKAPADDGKDRLLWTVVPTIGLEIDF